MRSDSGSTDSDAWLTAILPADGHYETRVRSGDRPSGAYELTVQAWAPRVVALGTEETAELGEGQPIGIWVFEGISGQAVHVAARSDAFAPTFEVWSSSGERLAWDDRRASGSGRRAKLPTDGRYEVRVRAGDGGMGAYQVAVRTAPAPNVTAPPHIARDFAPAASEAAVARLADGHRGFAFDLYRSLRSRPGNLIYSPYSLSLSFAMLAAGARGNTARQIADTLHFALPRGVLHPAVNALDLALRRDAAARVADAVPTGRAYQLAIANSLWSQTGSVMLPAFRDIMARHYGAGLQQVDFQSNPDGARRRINSWVREHTDGQVRELLAEGAVHSGTNLVLANAVAFEARWQDEFDESDTENRPFYLRGGAKVDAPTMRGDLDIGYAARDGYQVVDLHYKGGAAAMTLLLPDSGEFERFERSLDADSVEEAIASVEDVTVDLFMPRFEFETTVPLTETLKEMGMADAFDPARADLSGINSVACPAPACQYVDVVSHKAIVSVNEEGTKAAAASGLGITLVSGRPVLPEVRIDRPFVFLIRDVPTGTILFLGRVLDPR